jgi:hypothetical protein
MNDLFAAMRVIANRHMAVVRQQQAAFDAMSDDSKEAAIRAALLEADSLLIASQQTIADIKADHA